jgi:hypothetical protein
VQLRPPAMTAASQESVSKRVVSASMNAPAGNAVKRIVEIESGV